MDYKELPEDICETLLIELFQSIPQLLQIVAPDGRLLKISGMVMAKSLKAFNKHL